MEESKIISDEITTQTGASQTRLQSSGLSTSSEWEAPMKFLNDPLG